MFTFLLGVFAALTIVGVISSYYDRRPVPKRDLSPNARVARERVGDLYPGESAR